MNNEIYIPISVNKHSLENCIHHVFNFILIFLKLEDKNKVIIFYRISMKISKPIGGCYLFIEYMP